MPAINPKNDFILNNSNQIQTEQYIITSSVPKNLKSDQLFFES